jgi:hypothetical protein
VQQKKKNTAAPTRAGHRKLDFIISAISPLRASLILRRAIFLRVNLSLDHQAKHNDAFEMRVKTYRKK